ncbi:hypothetical protein D9M73_152640 [compost metagenome]
MRDGAAERRHRRHLWVDVDELVVASRIGELVDHFLADLDPVGHLFGADPACHFLDCNGRHGIPLKLISSHRRGQANGIRRACAQASHRPETGT